MEWLIAKLIKAGIGAFGDSFFKPWLSHLDSMSAVDADKFKTATGADKEVAIEQIKANTSAYHERANMKIIQWLIALALLPPIYHSGSIYLDSSPFYVIGWSTWHPIITTHEIGSWQVPSPPKPYDDREWQMIASLLGIASAATVGMGALRMWSRK